MQTRDYNAELRAKMTAEQEKYRDWLLTEPPDEILRHTHEYTVREDILCEMNCTDLSPKRAKALLRSPCPLADVFKDYEKLETDYEQTIRDTIADRADNLIKREKAQEAR